MTQSSQPLRIVLTTYGSFGDLHPYIALALELKERGHLPVIATSGVYREKVEPLGIDFHATRPDFPSPDEEPELTAELIKHTMDQRTGPEFVIGLFAKPVRESYEDLSEAIRGADVLVTHPITFAGPLLAQKTGIPWVSSLLSPLVLFSAHDPLIPPHMAGMAKWFARVPVPVNRIFRKMIDRMTSPWLKPVRNLREELGLPSRGNPMLEGQHSPALVLAMFSKVLVEPRPDWPPNTHVTGFCFYDRLEVNPAEPALAPELEAFLENGTPPILFTLGSAAVWDAERFYHESVEAALRLGERAVLLIGHEGNRPAKLPSSVIAVEYAPYGEIMPRARAIVHQGGVGTTGEALRAGKPTLFMPFSHDQPDNAWRVVRLGVARMLTRKQYKAARVAKELDALLRDERIVRRAEEVGRVVRAENGPSRAAELIEKMMSKEGAPLERRAELTHEVKEVMSAE